MISKEKIGKFFDKNYDYYILMFLILLSIIVTIIDHYEIYDTDTEGIYYNLPCFIQEQDEFIEHASLEINDLLPRLGVGVLIIQIIENLMGIIFILGFYFLGKTIFKKTKKEWLKNILIALGIFYLIILINAAIITPIGSCMVQIS